MVVCGVKIFYLCCVEYVCCEDVLVYVCFLFFDKFGIWVKDFIDIMKGFDMEEVIIFGVVYDCLEVKIIIVGFFDVVG